MITFLAQKTCVRCDATYLRLVFLPRGRYFHPLFWGKTYPVPEKRAPGRYVFGEKAVFIPTYAAKTGVGVGFCPSDTLKIPT